MHTHRDLDRNLFMNQLWTEREVDWMVVPHEIKVITVYLSGAAIWMAIFVALCHSAVC